MNRIDASDHYNQGTTASQVPSLLTVIIDTNPRAWAALHDLLPISKAVANLLVFINAHLAFGNQSHVAVLAAHTNRAVWLYPKPPNLEHRQNGSSSDDQDVEMTDIDESASSSANKFPQFAQIETTILASLRSLVDSTTPADLSTTTLVSGALSMALSYINKMSHAGDLIAPVPSSSSDPANPPSAAAANADTVGPGTLQARILVLSVSDSEPAQYIPTMNAVFAAAHAHVPVDTLSLRGSPAFLQQAAFITGGTFVSTADGDSAGPRGLLAYLMFGLLADAGARRAFFVSPTQDSVDFRAACFCHRRVVDTGFVCSVCLSIFCEPPAGAACLTCGTRLALAAAYGARPAVVPRAPKKKKRPRANGTGTPIPG
ncbi:transcription factor Tfb4 [Durotheca rogersii]|uniref:transcription factor Tfb4 n=1 Tax=Durotheca rogersii TaxID=419775 RepID=UPI002220B682|nr:transcription factor Tfb4 [Durotheca rogersii]KAI5860409.1 transcription factor Tfb4 [Durotheca rogersii]